MINKLQSIDKERFGKEKGPREMHGSPWEWGNRFYKQTEGMWGQEQTGAPIGVGGLGWQGELGWKECRERRLQLRGIWGMVWKPSAEVTSWNLGR